MGTIGENYQARAVCMHLLVLDISKIAMELLNTQLELNGCQCFAKCTISECTYTTTGGELSKTPGWFKSRHRQCQQFIWGLSKSAKSFNAIYGCFQNHSNEVSFLFVLTLTATTITSPAPELSPLPLHDIWYLFNISDIFFDWFVWLHHSS